MIRAAAKDLTEYGSPFKGSGSPDEDGDLVHATISAEHSENPIEVDLL
jgi:hypothetical protein